LHVSQRFLFCALKEGIEHFKQHAVGAVFDAIVVDTFKLIPFAVPPEKMLRLFEEAVAPMFGQVANLMEQNEKLRAARDLLNKLAKDFVEHCSTRWQTGKSMLVCIDKITCARMFQRIAPRDDSRR